MNLGAEDETKEFKESLAQLDKGLKSLTAMLNRNGFGTVYFGVSDNGDVIGTSIGKKTFEDIRNRVKDSIEPKIMIELKSETDEHGKEYVILKSEGTDMPYSFDGRYYIRNVSSDEKVPNDLLRKMLVSSDTDLIRHIASVNQELTFDSFCSYFASLGQYAPNKREYFMSKGFFNKDGRYNLMAYLLSDQSDISIKVVKFEGKDKTALSSRTEYGKKSLILSVLDVLHYFEGINTTNVKLSGGIRTETSLFNAEAFKEAWVNACLHNSWSNMIPPTVFLFDDRIEVLSYGGLPYGLSLESFYNGLSKPVNLSLLSIFNQARFSEQSGHGVPKIISAYSKDAFSFKDGTVCVTLKFAFEPDFVAYRHNKEGIIHGLTEKQSLVYYFIKDNPKMTLMDASEKLEISLSGVKKIVQKLQELELIERKGSKKEGLWCIK